MNVTTEEIRNIPAGGIRHFICEDGAKVRSARSICSIIKETGTMQDGVVDYDTKKVVLENGIILFVVRAMREGDTKVLSVSK